MREIRQNPGMYTLPKRTPNPSSRGRAPTLIFVRRHSGSRLFTRYSIGSRGQPIDTALGPTIASIRSTLPSLILNMWQSTRPLPVGFSSFADAPPPNAINAMARPFSVSTQTRRGPWLILVLVCFLKVTGEQSWFDAVVCKPFSQRSHTSANGTLTVELFANRSK